MKLFGLYLLGKRGYKKVYDDGKREGFRVTIDTMTKVLESSDRIVLGNNMAFVGSKVSVPITTIGDNQHWMNGWFTLDKKFKNCNSCVKIGEEL